MHNIPYSTQFFTIIPINEARIVDELEKAGQNLPNQTPSDRYHITLRYVAEITKEQLPDILTNLRNRINNHSAFTLTLSSEGNFPGGVHWMGVDYSVELMELQATVDRALQELGLPPSDFPNYQPHITLGMHAQPVEIIQPERLSWLVDAVTSNVAEGDEWGDVVQTVNLERKERPNFLDIRRQNA